MKKPSIAHKVYKKFRGNREILGVEFSEAIEAPNACAHRYAHGTARWPADSWLKAMFALGAFRVFDSFVYIPIGKIDDKAVAELMEKKLG